MWTVVLDRLLPLMTIYASHARVDRDVKIQVNVLAEMSRSLMSSKKMETIEPKSRV